jgi:6-phosphogluconolactonase (cycloisomerase 2 family)
LNEDGTIQPLRQCINLNVGSDKNALASHIHTVAFSHDENWLWATDLGKDKIYKFNIHATSDTILVRDTECTSVLEAGSGPRHLVLHPNGKWVYSINELKGTITVFKQDNGKLSAIQYIASDTTPGIGGKGSADIHLSPDCRFLYSSNRLKNDGIAIFSVNPDDGLLTKVAYQETGIHPRNFIISPNNKFLLCANRDSNSVQIFSRDEKTGLLTNTGKEILIGSPVCLKWISK